MKIQNFFRDSCIRLTRHCSLLHHLERNKEQNMRSKVHSALQALTVVGIAAAAWQLTAAPWFILW